MSKLKNKHAGSSFDAFMKKQGKKFDTGKAAWDLLPYESLEEVAKVLSYGAKVYGRYNWAKGIVFSRLIAASLRHINKFNNRQDFDEDTGINHLAHAACNLLFLLWLFKHRPDLDDRWRDLPKKKRKKRK